MKGCVNYRDSSLAKSQTFRMSIHPSVRSFVRPSVRSSIHPSMHHLVVYMYVYKETLVAVRSLSEIQLPRFYFLFFSDASPPTQIPVKQRYVIGYWLNENFEEITAAEIGDLIYAQLCFDPSSPFECKYNGLVGCFGLNTLIQYFSLYRGVFQKE